MSRLAVVVERQSHPFPNDNRSTTEAWGSLQLRVEDNVDCVGTTLLSIEWDIAAFADWFTGARWYLCHERLGDLLPEGCPQEGESIAAAVQRNWNRDFDDGEEEARWMDNLYGYRERHGLNFAFRGTITPEILVACNQGSGEVSCVDGDLCFRYNFSMNEFLNETSMVLISFLKSWCEDMAEEGRERLEPLLSLLPSLVGGCCPAAEA